MNEKQLIHFVASFGIQNADTIVHADHEKGRPTLARALAMIENESGGRNIFGADPGGVALPRQWFNTEVTRAKYETYRARRQQGLAPNGVGPTQITSPSLQIDADRRGGAWVPLHNCEAGFLFLHQLMEEFGVREGFRHYNGSGPAAVAYASRAMARTAIWETRLRGKV